MILLLVGFLGLVIRTPVNVSIYEILKDCGGFKLSIQDEEWGVFLVQIKWADLLLSFRIFRMIQKLSQRPIFRSLSPALSF